MIAWKRWQDWVMVVLGVLLFITPFVFGATAVTNAAWVAYIGGALLVIFGLVDLAYPAFSAGEWVGLIVGVLLFLAPWVLAYNGLARMAWSDWIIGVLAVLLAASVLFQAAGRGTAVTAPR